VSLPQARGAATKWLYRKLAAAYNKWHAEFVEALKQQNLIRRSLMKLIAAQLSKGTFLS
jgi:hypothetical protein